MGAFQEDTGGGRSVVTGCRGDVCWLEAVVWFMQQGGDGTEYE